MNKIISPFDLYTIENHIKDVNIKSNNIITPWLLQSKSYLKIIGISYLMENTNILVNSSIVKAIIKSMHIWVDI